MKGDKTLHRARFAGFQQRRIAEGRGHDSPEALLPSGRSRRQLAHFSYK
jgi:hypothetical protein